MLKFIGSYYTVLYMYNFKYSYYKKMVLFNNINFNVKKNRHKAGGKGTEFKQKKIMNI